MARLFASSEALPRAQEGVAPPPVCLSARMSLDHLDGRATTKLSPPPLKSISQEPWEAHVVQSLSSFLQTTYAPSILANCDARVIAQNEGATRFFAKSDELSVEHNRLKFSDSLHARQLHIELAAERAAPESPLQDGIIVAVACRRVMVETHALRLRTLTRVTCGLQTYLQLEIESLDTQRWFQLEQLMAKGLTPAESQIAFALYRGVSISEYAAAASIAVSTARTHLQRAMGKLQVSRQAQLVLLLVRLLEPNDRNGR